MSVSQSSIAAARAGSDTAGSEDHPASSSANARLEEIFRDESKELLRGLSKKANPGIDAEDLLQEAFYRLARMGEQALNLERPKAYLRRIANNILKDRVRERTREVRQLADRQTEFVQGSADQRSLLEARDLLNRIEASLAKLRPKTREIFMAHRIDGLTYAEIAEQTGLSIKGVEKQMSKALRQIDRLVNRA